MSVNFNPKAAMKGPKPNEEEKGLLTPNRSNRGMPLKNISTTSSTAKLGQIKKVGIDLSMVDN